jgi:DNA (cytosine-5)-methyltransferase 1
MVMNYSKNDINTLSHKKRKTATIEKSYINSYLLRLRSFTPPQESDYRFSCISLFSGGGGLDLGLSFAGFKSLVVSDIKDTFITTIKYNLPHVKLYAGDAINLNGTLLTDIVDNKNIDLMAAGPPCQSFSILGRRKALKDPRGKLTIKYFKLIAEVKPKSFIFENVPGILTVNNGKDWSDLLHFVKKTTGYSIHFKKLNSVNYGIPQIRERVVLVGFRKDIDDSAFFFPDRTFGQYTEFLQGESPSIWALENVEGLPNHKIRQHGNQVKNRYKKIPQGGRDIIDHTDRINPIKPSGTVLVGSSAGGGRPHIHPFEPRVITVREAARLQSFPDWYIFYGSTTDQYRQVGNAVPPLLAYEIGKQIGSVIDNV